jgi:hypothetical protein
MNNNPLEDILKHGYQNHVFISWPNSIEQRGTVIVKELQKALEDKMKSEIRGGGTVFLDINRLKDGYKWDEALRINLCRSAVLIVILVPTYFQSEYCLLEWAVIEKLQEHRLPESKSYETCFIHILLKDNMDLPDEIKKIQVNKDFSALMTYGRSIKQYPKWLKLIDNLLNNIKRICTSICETYKPDDKAWKDDEAIVKDTQAKQFTWPEEKQSKTSESRKKRSLTLFSVEKNK